MKSPSDPDLIQQYVLPLLQSCKRFLTLRPFSEIIEQTKAGEEKVSPDHVRSGWLHCARWGIIPKRYNTTVEIVYFQPSSCHHSSVLLPANTMTLFLRQLGNVLVTNSETISLPKHSKLRQTRSNLSSTTVNTKGRNQTERLLLHSD